MSQTAKVLLLYAHPESQDSVANRVLLKPATQLSNVTVHDLYAHYPDFFIDIPYEQELLRRARRDCVPASALYLQLSGAAQRVAGPRAEPGLLPAGWGATSLRESTGGVSLPPVSRKALTVTTG